MHDTSFTDSLTEANYNLVLWVPDPWSSENQKLWLRVKGLGIFQHACETVVSLLPPPVDASLLMCRGQGCVIAQVFADACYNYICCWTQPESHSSLNHIRPGPCSIDPGPSCEADRQSQLDCQKSKVQSSLLVRQKCVQKESCPVFALRHAVGDLWSPPETHHFYASVETLLCRLFRAETYGNLNQVLCSPVRLPLIPYPLL